MGRHGLTWKQALGTCLLSGSTTGAPEADTAEHKGALHTKREVWALL